MNENTKKQLYVVLKKYVYSFTITRVHLYFDSVAIFFFLEIARLYLLLYKSIVDYINSAVNEQKIWTKST